MKDAHEPAGGRGAHCDQLTLDAASTRLRSADDAQQWHSSSSVRTRASCATCGSQLYMTLAAMPRMFCRSCGRLA